MAGVGQKVFSTGADNGRESLFVFDGRTRGLSEPRPDANFLIGFGVRLHASEFSTDFRGVSQMACLKDGEKSIEVGRDDDGAESEIL